MTIWLWIGYFSGALYWSISDRVPLLCGIQLFRTRLITEILSHHQAVNAAIHDPYADASEVSLQNVSAMPG